MAKKVDLHILFLIDFLAERIYELDRWKKCRNGDLFLVAFKQEKSEEEIKKLQSILSIIN